MVAEPFTPTDRQRRIWELIGEAKDGSLSVVGYGGAAGGGKSRALAELAIDLALEYPGNRILVGRKDFSDLRTTTMEEFYKCIDPGLIDPQRGGKKNDSEHWCAIRGHGFPRGVTSRVFFRELKDWLSLGSEEYGAALVDEAGEVPESSALMLLSRLRHPAATKRVFVAASNPWPGWFERWFHKRELPEAVIAESGGSIHFVPAFMRDNPYLPANYEGLLRAMYPHDWVERFVEGKFGVFIGQVHAELDRGRHLWSGPLPQFKAVVGGLDFGGQNPWDHMTAGVVAGVVSSAQRGAPEDSIVRFAHFEDRGPRVYESLLKWIAEQERSQRVQWVGDKTQMWGIDQARRMGITITPSHGGKDSVAQGIGLQNRRFADNTSFFTEALLSPPSREAANRGAKSWFERMTEYRWAEPTGDDAEARSEPVKRNDDTPNADRYMHEAVDPWPRRDYVAANGTPIIHRVGVRW